MILGHIFDICPEFIIFVPRKTSMKPIQRLIHVHVKDSGEDFYFGSAAAMFVDSRVKYLLGMSYKTFRNKKIAVDEPYENEFVIVRRGVLLTREHYESLL